MINFIVWFLGLVYDFFSAPSTWMF
jgi:hypothetical protein